MVAEGMSAATPWEVRGLYFEACSCDSVCPCYYGRSPTTGTCEGLCVWKVEEGQYGGLALEGLCVIMAIHVEGDLGENPWKCWFYIDDRATAPQFEALKAIFTGAAGGHLAEVYKALWHVQSVGRAPIELKSQGWTHRVSVPRKLGAAIGLLKPEAGPTLCYIPKVPGIAAIADEDWIDDAAVKFNHAGKNALTTTFEYSAG